MFVGRRYGSEDWVGLAFVQSRQMRHTISIFFVTLGKSWNLKVEIEKRDEGRHLGWLCSYSLESAKFVGG
jgi:hypothetical protein